MRDTNLCVVAGTHGDEFAFGELVHAELERQYGGHVALINGNPRATGQGVRFVDTDLNRSFSGHANVSDGYERERAEEIRGIFTKEGFTHVVDIHTSPTTHGIVPILPGECQDERTQQVIDHLVMTQEVVVIPSSNHPSSLVGAFGKGGIGLECPRYNYFNFAGRIAYALSMLLLARSNSNSSALLKTYFDVVGNVPTDLDLAEDIPDFTFDEELQGYHFVTAPSIYKQYPGYTSQGMIVRRR